MSYTKGEWTVERKVEIGLTDGPVEVFEITQKASPYADFNTIGYAFSLEDATLLEAAPDMVEALEGLLRYWNRTGPMYVQYDKLQDHIDRAKRVLTKAKGGQG